MLGLSVLLVGFTATMDAFLWGMFNQPLAERRQAAKDYELRTLKADYARLAVEARQLQERADALSAALHSCESSFDPGPEVDAAPEFATPCLVNEVEVHTDDGQTLCLPGHYQEQGGSVQMFEVIE